MSAPPLKQIDPYRIARKNEQLVGSVKLQDCQRLVKELSDKSGEAQYALQFSQDSNRRTVVKGVVKVELYMECQRCLQPMSVVINEPISWMFVNSELALKNVPGEYEGIVMDANGVVNLAELLEEQILLGIPLIVKHSENCLPNSGDEHGSTKKS